MVDETIGTTGNLGAQQSSDEKNKNEQTFAALADHWVRAKVRPATTYLVTLFGSFVLLIVTLLLHIGYFTNKIYIFSQRDVTWGALFLMLAVYFTAERLVRYMMGWKNELDASYFISSAMMMSMDRFINMKGDMLFNFNNQRKEQKLSEFNGIAYTVVGMLLMYLVTIVLIFDKNGYQLSMTYKSISDVIFYTILGLPTFIIPWKIVKGARIYKTISPNIDFAIQVSHEITEEHIDEALGTDVRRKVEIEKERRERKSF